MRSVLTLDHLAVFTLSAMHSEVFPRKSSEAGQMPSSYQPFGESSESLQTSGVFQVTYRLLLAPRIQGLQHVLFFTK
ncbi:hypothetical protein WG66_011265 [Moniliophthora roreri]|nr:hypothetical protein WG66_011265 [Moniliophthora roreri]